LELSLDLELDSLDDWVLLSFLQIFVLAEGHQILLKLLELVLNLVLDVVKVERATAIWIFRNLECDRFSSKLNGDLDKCHAVRTCLVITIRLDATCQQIG
jgi:hypothetical protein